MRIERGDLVTARFPRHDPDGHEQEGFRPAIIVSTPWRRGPVRFRLVALVPLTTARDQAWAKANPELYPLIPAGTAGLPVASIALLDQIRTLDFTRVLVRKGTLTRDQYWPIALGLQKALELADE